MSTQPRILVACEYSGIVRDAFSARGWYALSCDLEPTEKPGNHYQGDVRDLLDQHWDLMVAHPPCTYLTNAGAKHLYRGRTKADKIALGYQKDPERWRNMEEGAAFFLMLWQQDRIEHIAVENPIMHGHGIERVGGRATQFIQPYEFGHLETKRTGLRLKNLPALIPTNDVYEQMKLLPKNQTHKVHYASPGKDRWKERSRTYTGIAQAMADQWGPYLEAKIADCAVIDPTTRRDYQVIC